MSTTETVRPSTGREVVIGRYVLDPGPAPGSSIARSAQATPGGVRERQRLQRALAHDDAQDKGRGPIDYVETAADRSDEVTSQVERAEALWDGVSTGGLDIASINGELDSLLGLLQKLDRDGRFEEQFRLARALSKLLSVALRWIDLLRALRGVRIAAEQHGHAAAQGWALHELGTVSLAADRFARADAQLTRAHVLRQELGDSRGAAATERTMQVLCRTLRECVRERELVQRRNWRRLLFASHAFVVLAVVLALGGATAAVAASGLFSAGTTPPPASVPASRPPHHPGGPTTAARATVSGLNPVRGPAAGGTTVTIRGEHLAATTRVTFGATPATHLRVISAGELQIATPAGSGSVAVSVITAAGASASSASARYTYLAPAAPALAHAQPSSGPAAGGTEVTITGTGLTAARAVMFGPNAGTHLQVLSDRELLVAAPAGSGTVAINVRTASGATSTGSALQFTYTTAPAIANLSPSTGPESGGLPVTITGTGLGHVTTVMFGGSPAANLHPVSDTQLQVNAPSGSGSVAVTATTPTGQSALTAATQFTYISPPRISGLSIRGATGGTALTVIGSGLALSRQATWTGQTGTTVSEPLGGSASDSSTTVTLPLKLPGTTCPGAQEQLALSITTPGGTAVAPTPVIWLCPPPG